ncbi:MAG: hypothetical protein JST80_06375 [Bdellovibrionales bacterium]|nr:hypothetical protein [Bdellovibrionales bacterium]
MFWRNFISTLLLAVGIGVANDNCASAQVKLKYPAMTRQGFAQLKDFHKKILKQCSPPSCLQLFIGRSSILISAYAESIGLQDSYVTIPLSGVKNIAESEMEQAEKNFKKFVLDEYLKTKMKSGSYTRVSVIDFVNSGDSAGPSAKFVKSWIDENFENPPEVELVTYGKSISEKSKDILEKSHIKHSMIPFPIGSGQEGDLTDLIFGSKSEGYAPYLSWNAVSDNFVPVINRNNRNHYKYVDKSGANAFASYAELIKWMKDPVFAKPCDGMYWNQFTN